MGTPTVGYVMRILDDIDEARARGGTAYVHCWGGVGRTGTVIGCWLMRHALDGGDPIARIAVLRAAVAGERPSPETPDAPESSDAPIPGPVGKYSPETFPAVHLTARAGTSSSFMEFPMEENPTIVLPSAEIVYGTAASY
jgi:hypothetical protein